MPRSSASTIDSAHSAQVTSLGGLRLDGACQQLSATGISIEGAHGPVPATLVDVGPRSKSVPPFVFLHGLVGLNEHWENVVRRFSTTARCIMLQIPLLDLSGEDCSIQGVSALTARFLESYFGNEGSLPVALVGNSFGGHVALRLAIERPDLVQALVLAGSSGLIEKSMVSDVQIRPSREWLRRKIGELFYDRKHLNENDIERAYKELSSRSGARAMVKLSRSARRNHLGSKLGQIRVPTLLIWGREDIVTPPEAAEGFRASIPSSRIVWFDRCGHAPMIECPEQFADAMTGFISDIRR
ncbi:MAG: alpha/beta hydrolase [Phycisphaeraceae bacterium]|nr:alpha/beta hydrolase [Phycisphaeraceae bacterium]